MKNLDVIQFQFGIRSRAFAHNFIIYSMPTLQKNRIPKRSIAKKCKVKRRGLANPIFVIVTRSCGRDRLFLRIRLVVVVD